MHRFVNPDSRAPIMMKSVALILWLTLANGKEQVILTQHMNTQDECVSTARAKVEQHTRRGEKTRYICHEVIEEVGGVDDNGNPLLEHSE